MRQIFDTLSTCHSDKYIQWVKRALLLPLTTRAPRWGATAHDARGAILAARATMDAVATGFDDVKTEILKLVCQQAHGSRCASAFSIGLEGPPGTGKTHFARNAIARVLDRPLVEIQLGGATDISYLMGIIYSYEGAKEGRLAAGLIESGVRNPIFYFDEVDKISDTERGRELAAVLIHLIDPTANTAMRDRFFHGIDLDFSECLFLFSYNDPLRVSPILLDRIKTFRIDRPTLAQRCEILGKHIVPRVAARLGTTQRLDAVALAHIAEVSERRDGGMRGAEKDVDHVMALAQLKCAEGTPTTAGVSAGGVITRAFAEGVLRPRQTEERDVPPTGMYM